MLQFLSVLPPNEPEPPPGHPYRSFPCKRKKGRNPSNKPKENAQVFWCCQKILVFAVKRKEAINFEKQKIAMCKEYFFATTKKGIKRHGNFHLYIHDGEDMFIKIAISDYMT